VINCGALLTGAALTLRSTSTDGALLTALYRARSTDGALLTASRVIVLWNRLPVSVVLAEDIQMFKKLLKHVDFSYEMFGKA